jgi:phenylacetate-CoA ligase
LRLPAQSGCTGDARLALRALLGELPLSLHAIEEDDKIMQYSSDLDDAR